MESPRDAHINAVNIAIVGIRVLANKITMVRDETGSQCLAEVGFAVGVDPQNADALDCQRALSEVLNRLTESISILNTSQEYLRAYGQTL